MTESMDLFENPKPEEVGSRPYVIGTLAATFFDSPDIFYKVLLINIKETSLDWHEDQIVVTGDFAEISEDVSYRFIGKLVKHPKYGAQFQAQNYEAVTQTSKKGLINYLSGTDFPGIGRKTAENVVNVLGTNLIEIVLNDPSRLNKVKLNSKQTHTIIAGLKKNNGVEQTIVGLNSFGFGSSLASAIYKKYGTSALEKIRENPYRLVEDIAGISFKKADRIARQLGIGENDEGRLRAGIITALNQLSVKNGNTFSNAKEVLDEARDILTTNPSVVIDDDKLLEALRALRKDQEIMIDEDNRIFLRDLYEDEIKIANNVKRIESEKPKEQDDRKIKTAIAKVEKEVGIHYDESQKTAIRDALKKPMFLLTGGPGTGKTTIINGIVKAYAELNQKSLDINQYKDKPFPILLAAPTGRAAKKMHDSTSIPASTIHRLLGLTGHVEDETANDLSGGILIIDEMSMVDTQLFEILIQAVSTGMQVILVGDKDQLPSVGPGQVFSDLLSSGTIPQIELNQIHRQGDDSTIVTLAHDIKNGVVPDQLLKNQPDRSFITAKTNQVPGVIDQIIAKAKRKGFTSSDIQVLAPMYRGAAGVDRLNFEIQNIMNKKTSAAQKEVRYKEHVFRIGDKVQQLVNVPENNVYNGDIGKIVGIDVNSSGKHYLDKITVAFDQTEVTYTRNDWSQLTLAYATSIHKAQGSEFEMVILPIVPQYHRMLQRNLLYTAVTRSSKMLIMIGDPDSFCGCIKQESTTRKTCLKIRLQSVMGKTQNGPSKKSTNYQLTTEKILADSIDPMIGMEGVKPGDFDNAK